MTPEFVKEFSPFPLTDKPIKSSKNSIPGLPDVTSKISWIEEEFDAALNVSKEDRDRESESWKLFSGLENGQWSDEALSTLKEEKRNPFQANFIRNKVTGYAGSLVKNLFDLDFETTDDDQIEGIQFLKSMMYSDKELLDWNNHYMQAVVAGCVHESALEIYISTKYSPLGNLGLRYIQPGHIIFDPFWISNDTTDLRRAWKVGYFTADQIKKKWKHKTAEIDEAIKSKLYSSTDFDNGDIFKDGFAHKELNERYGDTYRVIEYHHIEEEERKVRFAVADGTILPEKEEDVEEYAAINGIDLSYGTMENKIQMKVYYVSTICPELSVTLMLEDRPGSLQIGRLPFFPWSVARINGKNSGLPALLKSVQQTYNKRESMIDHMIATSANGGMLIDPDIVDNDEARMERLQRNWNTPSYKDWAAPNSISSGRQYFAELPNAKVDFGIINDMERISSLSDRIGYQTATNDGRAEYSAESGILFARKQLQTEISQTTILRSLEFLWNEIGEAYFFSAKRLYGNIYREFVIPSTGERIEVNKPINTPNGQIIKNDLSKLSRVKIIVTQSPEGVSQKAVDRAINIEFLRVLGNDNPLARATAIHNVMGTLSHSLSEKKEFQEAAAIEKELVLNRALTELMQLKAAQIQIQQSMSQQGQQPQEGQGGEPQSGEGEQEAQPPQPAGNPNANMVQNSANAGSMQ